MWTFYHASTFILTFISYAFFHATRKTFSNVKSTISSEWSATPGNATLVNKPDNLWNDHHMFASAKDAETYLGILDAVFMVSYAVGLYISGIIGDRFELRKVLSLGMCSSAVSVLVFGSVLEWSHYYNKYLYVAVWICNGLLQSLGWPTVVAIMGNWFGKSSRGLVLGLWSACASVGNIIGALMVSQVLQYGYDYAFLVTSTVLFAGGIINFFGLINSPTEIGLQSPDEIQERDYQITVNQGQQGQQGTYIEDDDDDDRDPLLPEDGDDVRIVKPKAPEKEEALSFWKALLLPGVLMYAFAYFCLKLVNYSFFFWLPYYLHASFGWLESVADKISIWYDIGGIVGGTIAGIISDCVQKRSIVVVPMLILAIPSLIWYSNSPNDMTMNAVLMTVTGFFIGGVANLISAAISADLGKQGPIQGNKAALATVTGIVDGTGSVGAALGQILVPLLQERIGWHSVFYLFIAMTISTIFCIIPMFIREVPECYHAIRNCCRKYTYSWYCGCHTQDSQRSRSVNGDTNESRGILDD
ncbi:sugar phosphate exchanger 3-like [Ruditapes philippinarum]|uniref:sugar phosphate exchanger 3-like n=1 Tax=Ruditapes philippinarum TaxID=129788 RepID=UPI00295AA225|nr:sugar phosphate exchanger 3-like [Ruditapes philippinarum]